MEKSSKIQLQSNKLKIQYNFTDKYHQFQFCSSSQLPLPGVGTLLTVLNEMIVFFISQIILNSMNKWIEKWNESYLILEIWSNGIVLTSYCAFRILHMGFGVKCNCVFNLQPETTFSYSNILYLEKSQIYTK